MKPLSFLVLPLVGLLTANQATAQVIALAIGDSCKAAVGPLGETDLLFLVPESVHRVRNMEGQEAVKEYSALTGPENRGTTWTLPNNEVSGIPYEITDGRVCEYDPNKPDYCFEIYRCTEGSAEWAGIDENGDAWAIQTIRPDPQTKMAMLREQMFPSVNVARQAYDTGHIAPAADWQADPNDAFRGMPGVQGVYVAEGAAGPIVKDYLTAQDYSTGRRISDGRRDTDTLLRVFRNDRDTVTLDGSGTDGDGWYAVLGSVGGEDDKLDLETATPGVIALVTDETGTASEHHWVSLETRRFWSYLPWDAATHAAPVEMRVITPRIAPLSTRSLLVCDATEYVGGVPQTEIFGPEETCLRYDRAFEVTEFLDGRNALQIAATLGTHEGVLVMQVGEIAIAEDTISIVAQPFEAFVLINTGQFMGWDDWIDRTSRAGRSSGKSIICSLPMSAATDLATLEVGSLLRFRAELAQASERSVQLNCEPA